MKLNNLITPLLLICSITAFSQKAENVMFADFKADGKVLKLDIQSNIDYPYLILGFAKDGILYTVDFNARQGIHHYDLRFLDKWEGEIDYLVTNLDKRTIRRSALVEPTLIDELDILLDREIFSIRAVNLVKPKTFLGCQLSQIVFIIAIILTVSFYFLGKKNLPIAIFISFLLSTILLDARIIFQHFRAVQQIEYKYPYLDPLTEIQRFLENIKPIIKEGAWTFQEELIDEYSYLFIKNNLADIPFLKEDLEQYPVGTYIITVLPPRADQKIVLARNGFNLLQQL